MTFRMELTHDEIIDTLNIKHIGPKTFGYFFPPEIYEIIDNNSMLKS